MGQVPPYRDSPSSGTLWAGAAASALNQQTLASARWLRHETLPASRLESTATGGNPMDAIEETGIVCRQDEQGKEMQARHSPLLATGPAGRASQPPPPPPARLLARSLARTNVLLVQTPTHTQTH
ncbi:hypothetical protein MAPG_00642 [Magnaporthiopsis poae ATCC 64411]|uniref:Uncharacterized protein n=1 Tax=Magnaporthiopsis poae (strain ATCC 64411 / 73-15) TaxID=644358 RepID=A0A0C4DLJ8_MAGP6|nr:hypothetical protein MAPG_00642 [Magnaporthiopsis poae ATCC 64411]